MAKSKMPRNLKSKLQSLRLALQNSTRTQFLQLPMIPNLAKSQRHLGLSPSLKHRLIDYHKRVHHNQSRPIRDLILGGHNLRDCHRHQPSMLSPTVQKERFQEREYLTILEA